MSNVEKHEYDQFDWIQLQKDMDKAVAPPETFKMKMSRKINENPLVPAGCLLTSCALGYGLWCFQKGDSQKSQTMMRCRITAQGFTIVALLVGIGMAASKKN